MPAAAVRESKDRVRAALSTSGYTVPASRITVHLGPADIPKTGGRFDLAIALGVLLAQQDAAWPVADTEFLGELALNGDLRPINGALPAVLAAQQAGSRARAARRERSRGGARRRRRGLRRGGT